MYQTPILILTSLVVATEFNPRYYFCVGSKLFMHMKTKCDFCLVQNIFSPFICFVFQTLFWGFKLVSSVIVMCWKIGDISSSYNIINIPNFHHGQVCGYFSPEIGAMGI